jgi:ABC-type nitrate/sulfonate/bicarbonate transport system substrate-binding protein
MTGVTAAESQAQAGADALRNPQFSFAVPHRNKQKSMFVYEVRIRTSWNDSGDQMNTQLNLAAERPRPSRARKAGAGIAAAGAVSLLLAACGSVSGSSGSGGASSSAATSSAAGSGQTSHISVQLDYLENVQFGGSFVADTSGYYQAAGLSVSLVPDGSNASVEPAVESGQALIGITHTTELAQAISNGADLKVIGAGYQKNPFCVISRAGAPISTPQDLVGKKIGVATANQPLFNAYLKANNVNPAKVDVVTVQYDPTPLADGQVDGYVGFYNNEPIQLEQEGVKVHTMLMNDTGLPFMEELYIVKSSSLNDPVKKTEISAFMRAEQKGWQATIKDPARAAQLAVSDYGKALKLNLKQQTLEAQAQNDLLTSPDTQTHGLFWMSPASIASTVKSLGIGGTTVSPAVFTDEILSGL